MQFSQVKRNQMDDRHSHRILLTEIFLPTKGGTAVSLDDDFRRLGGGEALGWKRSFPVREGLATTIAYFDTILSCHNLGAAGL